MLRKGLLAALFCMTPLALSETADAGHGWRHHGSWHQGAGYCGSATTVYRAPIGHSYANYGHVGSYYGASPYASAYRNAQPYSAYRAGGYGLGYGGYGWGNRGGYGLGYGRPYGGYGAGWGAVPFTRGPFTRGPLDLSIGARPWGW